jgi:hypothetical protein
MICCKKNCLKEYGKELTLLLDTKTRCALMHIKKEMTFYEATNECPKVLKRLKHCLESLPPSSVEAERCFSAAGLFTTKLRSNLNDEMIDNLC